MKKYFFILIFSIVALHVGAAPLEVDTLDEDDYLAMRDTMKMPRRNLARQGTVAVDLRDYAVRDVYVPPHQTFDKYWYDHIYVGGGLGVERLAALSDDASYKLFTSLNLHVGKQFSKYSSVRVGLSGGWGYQNNTSPGLGKVGLKVDYLHNLSTLLSGYNPARRMEASLLAGLGGSYVWASGNGHAYAPEAHVGVQLKCYTGPQGVINIEPYVGIGTDKLDLANNYHSYDLFYGMMVNYSFFTDDNLSKEARLKLLQDRMADERMVTPMTLEKWRTPWFVEYAVGPVLVPTLALSTSNTIGNSLSLSLGRWLSPVMGFRMTVATRLSRYTMSGDAYYAMHYVYGGVDALLNPFGFFRSFRWNAPWGACLSLGVGMGGLTMTKDDTCYRSETYRLGLHFWGRLSEDLRAFVEPYFAANVYSSGILKNYGAYGLNLGLTMLIRSHKFRDPYEMDNTQNYTYRNVRGIVVGVAGGMPVMQNTAPVYSRTGADWNAMAFVTYRFNQLHGIRLQAEVLGLSTGETDDEGTLGINHRQLFFGSLNYQLNLTNLCSGRFIDRKVELDGFLGPAFGIASASASSGKMAMVGADLGLQLNVNIWKGISAFLAPMCYFMNYGNDLPGLNTIGFGDFHFFHTINIGVQYKIGSLHTNAERRRLKAQNKVMLWKKRQLERQHEWQFKQNLKLKKKKKRYGY